MVIKFLDINVSWSRPSVPIYFMTELHRPVRLTCRTKMVLQKLKSSWDGRIGRVVKSWVLTRAGAAADALALVGAGEAVGAAAAAAVRERLAAPRAQLPVELRDRRVAQPHVQGRSAGVCRQDTPYVGFVVTSCLSTNEAGC